MIFSVLPCVRANSWQRYFITGLENMLIPNEDLTVTNKSGMSGSSNNSSNSSFFGFGRSRTRSQQLNNSGQGGINLANISCSDVSVVDYREPAPEDLISVEEKMILLNKVFYITDTVIIDAALAKKLIKCNLEGSSLMVRSNKEKLFDSSEQIQIGQSRIMGFLDVDGLVALCKSTQWTTYKIWQAVKSGDLQYLPVLYVRADLSIKEALKLMILKSSKFAVVKKGNREVGMIGEHLIREALG